MRIITDQEFLDITVQYMTDDEKYEIEGLATKRAIARFIRLFGLARWREISTA